MLRRHRIPSSSSSVALVAASTAAVTPRPSVTLLPRYARLAVVPTQTLLRAARAMSSRQRSGRQVHVKVDWQRFSQPRLCPQLLRSGSNVRTLVFVFCAARSRSRYGAYRSAIPTPSGSRRTEIACRRPTTSGTASSTRASSGYSPSTRYVRDSKVTDNSSTAVSMPLARPTWLSLASPTAIKCRCAPPLYTQQQ